ncbi:MAG TPA: transposase, partial [Opitutae bacterium]|nr:transposase [Opitutae bacterium]
MPRKQGIEYPGAIYHVISRGNYRKELFLKANTGEA